MKYLLFLLIFPTLVHANEDCRDIAEPMMFRWVITDKIDDHAYEIASTDRGAGNPGIHAIMRTSKAVFVKPGFPFGLKVKLRADRLQVKLENGFTTSYQVYDECAVVPLPDHAVMWEPGMSVRSRIKKIDGEVK